MQTTSDGKPHLSAMETFRTGLSQRFWEYQQAHFEPWQDFIDQLRVDDLRPPVFLIEQASKNILTKPGASTEETQKLIAMVPGTERHKWFRSMNSSQALAQSILGNLALYGYLELLGKLRDIDNHLPIFEQTLLTSENFIMEYKVNYLGERRPTSLDVYFRNGYRAAVECKFTEADVGACSRPNLNKTVKGYCNGIYGMKKDSPHRCPLSWSGVNYWCYVPLLFKWAKDGDYDPCPLWKNYQLVRNILAAGVKPDGAVSPKNGHAVLIYDARNPAFTPGGKGYTAFEKTRAALHNPSMLRKCSWQQIVSQMRAEEVLPWLTEQLEEKYGL